MALQAGKSVRWVADHLDHADHALTLRVYAHSMPEDEADVSFADFGAPRRPYTALVSGAAIEPGCPKGTYPTRESLVGAYRKHGCDVP